MQPLARLGLTALVIAAGYLACVTLSMTLRFLPDGWAIFWPMRAFMIAVLMLLPSRQWWLIGSVIPVHFLVSAILLPQAPLYSVSIQFLGHLGVALASVLVIRRLVPTGTPFGSVASLFRFIVVVGIAVPAAINLITIGLHVATGWFGDLWLSWWQWMAAGFFVTITIPPLLVLLVQGGFSGRPKTPPGLRLEIAAVTAAVFATSFLVFSGLVDVEDWPAGYLAPLPLLLWAAVRFGVGGTALALLAMAAGIVVQAVQLHGPFSGRPVVDEVVSLHIFLAASSAPLMLLAALIDERRRTATLLRQSEDRMQFAAGATDTVLWQWDADPPRLWLTDNCRAIFGLTEETATTPLAFLDAVHADDRDMVGTVIRKAIADGEPQPTIEFRLGSGERTRWFILEMRAECDQVRQPALVSGVFRDVTERAEARREVARLQERLASLRQDERRRIAEELHDSTAQHLVAAKFNLLTLRRQVSAADQELVDEAYRSLREATAEIRTFTYLLHSAQLDDEGLCALLRRYVPSFERRTGVSTALRLTERADELPGDLQHALLRITQESLGNLQRHAGATHAAVNLRCIGRSVHLVVCDNGKGIGPEESERLSERLRLGLGIPDIAVRIRATRCRACGDCGGGGTAIHVAVPLGIGAPASADIAELARANQPG